MMSAMKFRHEIRYDASPDQVYAMLEEPHFREQVCQAMHAVSYDVTIESGEEPTEEGMTVVVDQTQPAHGFPSVAKRFVGDHVRILQKETWHDPARAGLEVSIPGKPGHLHADITLTESGDGTVETVSGEVNVHLPVVGGKLERLISDVLGQALATEEKVGRRWLAGDRTSG